MKISKRKKYVTRSGLPVRIYATDGPAYTPGAIHGAIRMPDGWFAHTWDNDGFFYPECKSESDLVEVKPKRRKREKA